MLYRSAEINDTLDRLYRVLSNTTGRPTARLYTYAPGMRFHLGDILREIDHASSLLDNWAHGDPLQRNRTP